MDAHEPYKHAKCLTHDSQRDFAHHEEAEQVGTASLALQIIRERKTSIVHIGVAVTPEEWDGAKVIKKHPNSVRLNNLIRKKLTEATDKSLEHDEVSAKILKKKTSRSPLKHFSGKPKSI